MTQLRRLTLTLLVLSGALNFSTIFAPTAPAQDDLIDPATKPTCETYSDPSLKGAWPADGKHFFWCGGAIGNTSVANQVAEIAAGISSTAAGKIVEGQGETYYIFQTRDESKSYWGSGSQQYSLTTSCGKTGYTLLGGAATIISAIYVDCHNYLTGQDVPSVSYPEVTAHETGHAFDFALASQQVNKNQLPSESQGMLTVSYNDFTNLNRLVNGKPLYTTCFIFGSKVPSGIESRWPNPPLPEVCSGSGVVNSYYASKNNEQVANLVSLYFVYEAPLYEELFAQAFAKEMGETGFGVVPATDSMILTYSCTLFVMNSYRLTGKPPQSLTGWPMYCTPVPASQF